MKTFKLDKDGMFSDFHSAIAGFFMFVALMYVIVSPLIGGLDKRGFVQTLLFVVFWAVAFYLHKYKHRSSMIYIMEILVIIYLAYDLLF